MSAAVSDSVSRTGTGLRRRVRLGETGLDISPVVLSGFSFGSELSAEDSHRVLDSYIERGGNVVHTCDSFAEGKSQEIIGQWLRSQSREIHLAVRVGSHLGHQGLGPVNLVRAVESSLTALGAERIDLLYLDAQAHTGSLEQTLATLAWLQETGKVVEAGGYEFTAEQLIEARVLSSSGYPQLRVVDIPHGLLSGRRGKSDLAFVASAQKIAVTPSWLVQDWRDRHAVGRLSRRGAAKMFRALRRVARARAVGMETVTVAWALAQSICTALIFSAENTQIVDQAVEGSAVQLTRAEMADITQAAS